MLVDRAADLHLRRHHDISYSLFAVLLMAQVLGRPSQREIADRLGVTRASITQRVAQLVARGLIDVTPSAEDARAVQVAVTDAGLHLLAQAWHSMEAADGGIDVGVDTAVLERELDLLIANACAFIERTTEQS